MLPLSACSFVLLYQRRTLVRGLVDPALGAPAIRVLHQQMDCPLTEPNACAIYIRKKRNAELLMFLYVVRYIYLIELLRKIHYPIHLHATNIEMYTS